MRYSAGTLDLSILGTSNEAIASIDKTVKSLNSLSRAITKIYNLPVLSSANNLTMFFQKIADSTSKIDTSKLSNLAVSAKGLSSISNLSKLDKVDWDKAVAGFNKLDTAIAPFIQKVKEAESSLTALYGILNTSSSKKINGLLDTATASTTATNSRKNIFSNLFTLGKWTAILYTARRVGRVIGDMVVKGSAFGETLNLWQVSMGQEFLPQATEFVDKLNEAYGISKKTLMNSQAIFKNMLGSLGQISEETAYQLSEGITQMALDYASLYNVKFEDAMTKFQAALAGQVRPIRSVAGYDITETTLFQLYQQLGGTKTMRQLSRTEKQLLSIYAVFSQMERSGATGDLKRTIESFANQSRVMADSWNDILTYSGLIVTRTMQQYGVMQKLNAVLIFASRVVEGIANSIEDKYSVPSDVFGDIAQSGEVALDTTEELKNALLDFDKFRALDTSKEENTFGIDETLVKAIDKYNSILSSTDMESAKLAEDWIQKLGGIENIISKVKGFFDDIKNSNAFALIKEMYETLSKLGGIFGDDIYYWIKTIREEIDNDAFGLFLDIWRWFNDNILTEETLDGLDGILQWLKDWNEEIKDATPFEKLVSLFEKLTELLDELGFDDMWTDVKKAWFGGGIFGFADGGLPDKGTVFVAGEAGAEMVYNTPSGQSGVANVQQIAQATYQGTMSALRDWWGGTGAKGDIPQLREANPTGMYEAVTGVAKSYGYKWTQY